MHPFLLALLLAGCQREDYTPPDEVPTSGQRVELPPVEFTKWVDFLTLQGGLDDDCRWLWPLVDDDSVAYPPLQGFWVIYENPSDVLDGTAIEDTFFLGDRLDAADFPIREGLQPLGFKFPPPFQQSFLDIERTEVTRDGHLLEADFGSPIEVLVHAEATPGDGECEVTTTWCDDPCDGTWAPLGSIYIELGALFAVEDVQILPP